MKNIKKPLSLFLTFIMILSFPFMNTALVKASTITTYYVAKTGSDSNSGTQGQPFLTIAKAVTVVVAGDTVLVDDGIYQESLNITIDGTESAYITYKSMNKWGAKIEGTDYSAIAVSGNYTIVDGFDLKGKAGYGIEMASNTKLVHHNIVRNNYIHDSEGGGIQACYGDYFTFEDNIMARNSWLNKWQTSNISIYQSRAFDANPGFHNIIRNNICYAARNTVKNDSGTITDGNGIIFDDSRNTQNGSTAGVYNYETLIENNLVYGNYARGIHVYEADNVTIRNNTTYNNGSDFGYEIGCNSAANVKFSNNIAYGKGTNATISSTDSTNVEIRNNLVFNGTVGSEVSSAFGNKINVDPKFVNAFIPSDKMTFDPRNPSTMPDFHIQAGSPAIDAGSTIYGVPSLDFDKKARKGMVDIGAYDYHDASIANITLDQSNEIVKAASYNLSGKVNTSGVVKVNNNIVTLNNDLTFSTNVNLSVGQNTISVAFTDNSSNSDTEALKVTYDDGTPPIISVDKLTDTNNQPLYTINGSLDKPGFLKINNINVPVSETLTFSRLVALQNGINKFTLTAFDAAGNNSAPIVVTITSTLDPSNDLAQGYAKSSKISQAITVDGNISESNWNLDKYLRKPGGVGTYNNEVKYDTAWDATNLYVAVQVKDSSLKSTPTSSSWWNDDGIEIYVDGNNKKNGAYDSTCRQFVIRYKDTALQGSSNNANVQYAQNDITGGYTVEIAVPWSNLGITPEDGKMIGFDVANNDNDNGIDREYTSFWNGTDTNYNDSSNFGNLYLSDVSLLAVATEPTDTIVIDGKIDENSWKLVNKLDKIGSGVNNNNVSFGTLCDNNYLYVAAKVLDGTLNSTPASTDWWLDDGLEIYVNGDNKKAGTYNSNDRQYVIRYKDSILNGTGSQDGVLFAQSDIVGGYEVEIAIPWTNIGVTASKDMKIGLDVANNDSDTTLGVRDGTLFWSGTDANHNDTSGFGNLLLHNMTLPANQNIPIVLDYNITTNMGTEVIGKVVGTILDQSALAYTLGTTATNGIVTVGPDGNWSYKPNPTFIGTDNFTVKVTSLDGTQANSTVKVDVKLPKLIQGQLVLNDDCGTLDKVFSKSSDISVQGWSPENFNNDTTRIHVLDNTDPNTQRYLIYKSPEQDFYSLNVEATMSTSVTDDFKFYESQDGISYKEFTPLKTRIGGTSWATFNYSCLITDVGIKYIKIGFPLVDQGYKASINKVTLTYKQFVLNDDCATLDKVFSKSPDISVQGWGHENFNNDTTRFHVNDNTDPATQRYLIYKTSEGKDFNFLNVETSINSNTIDNDDFKFYASSDGINYTEITPLKTTIAQGNWYTFNYSSSIIDVGIKYVKIGFPLIKDGYIASVNKISLGEIVAAKTVDKTALTTAITTATTLIASKTVGAAVGNVTQIAKDAFQIAITTATTINANNAATQAEVDAQVVAIGVATTNFNNAVIVVSHDTTALSLAIKEAQLLYDAAQNGEGNGNKLGLKSKLLEAIRNAKAVVTNALATSQTDIDAAVTALNAVVVKIGKHY